MSSTKNIRFLPWTRSNHCPSLTQIFFLRHPCWDHILPPWNMHLKHPLEMNPLSRLTPNLQPVQSPLTYHLPFLHPHAAHLIKTWTILMIRPMVYPRLSTSHPPVWLIQSEPHSRITPHQTSRLRLSRSLPRTLHNIHLVCQKLQIATVSQLPLAAIQTIQRTVRRCLDRTRQHGSKQWGRNLTLCCNTRWEPSSNPPLGAISLGGCGCSIGSATSSIASPATKRGGWFLTTTKSRV